MPRSTRIKVTKKPVVHPHSRAANKMTKRAHHDNRMERRLIEKSQRLDILGEKLKWFKDNVDMEKTSYTKEEAYDLIENYLSRFEEELEQIAIVNSLKGRKGQQYAARQDAIKITLERENREYTTTGLELPDLINAKNLDIFKKWSGEMRYVPNIRMKKMTKPVGIHREISRDNSNEQVCVESPEVIQVPELETVVSSDNNSAKNEPVSREELQNTCFADMQVD